MAETSQSVHHRLLGGRVCMEATPHLYAAGEDASWLALAAAGLGAQTYYEAGFGTGAAGLGLLALRPDSKLFTTEKHPPFYQQGLANAQLNNAQERLTLKQADHLTTPQICQADAAYSNPPFHAISRGFDSPNPHKAMAHGRGFDMADWLDAMAKQCQQEAPLLLMTHSADEKDLQAYAQARGYGLVLARLQSRQQGSIKRVLALFLAKRSGVEVKTLPTYDENFRQRHLIDGDVLTLV